MKTVLKDFHSGDVDNFSTISVLNARQSQSLYSSAANPEVLVAGASAGAEYWRELAMTERMEIRRKCRMTYVVDRVTRSIIGIRVGPSVIG